MFRALPVNIQTQLTRTHKNLGHPNTEQFGRALRDHGWAIQQAVRDMTCDTCHEMSLPKVSRPGHLREARDFNGMVQFDGVEWKDPQGRQYCFHHFVDTATNFHMAIPYHTRTTGSLIQCFQTAWLSWAGPPKSLMFDSATESNSEACVFVLPRDEKTPAEATATNIHGIIGIHVDDGIGGGDQEFHKKLKCLEAKFPFGSHRKRGMIFTGLHIHQTANGEIQVDQKEYIQDIPPNQISKDRRTDLKNPVLPPELQSFRGLIGSLQYAATNTRPDIACRLSLLQAKIPTATVEDLLEGNRLLMEAKKHSNVSIKYRTIPIQKIRFATFSDAAFASREKAHSQKGCLVLTTSDQIDHDVSAPISALAWYSKKISRVVGSTLASETYALSGALDLLGWLRIHWAWLISPSLEWQKPEQVYAQIPKAFAIVDCKSLYDLLQKTSIPQCSEYRTTLQALIIKDRLFEGVAVKWVHSAAQMADALTKHMDATPLRLLLEQGHCRIHDIDVVLQQRADKKLRHQWIQDSSQAQ